MIDWTRAKGYGHDSRTVKVELVDLLRLLYILRIRSVMTTEYAWIFEFLEYDDTP